MSETTQPVLGIDIAKATYEAALLVDDVAQQKGFKNTPTGYAQMARWLKKRGVDRVHACMEATGQYGVALAAWLREQGHVVSVVNPMAIRRYADSQLRRNKTDRLDALLIARYCAKERPPAWAPVAAETAELQALLRELESLRQARVRESNRSQSGISSPVILDSIHLHLAFLDEQIKRFEKLVKDLIDSHPDMRQQYDLLISIPGIGPAAAAYLIACQMSRFEDARAVAAFAGLSPRVSESGTSVRRKTQLCKWGDSSLRKVLYWPAITALRCNPFIMALGERLEKRGKHSMVVIGAAMRKLLCLAYGVLKSGQPFDARFVHQHGATP